MPAEQESPPSGDTEQPTSQIAGPAPDEPAADTREPTLQGAAVSTSPGEGAQATEAVAAPAGATGRPDGVDDGGWQPTEGTASSSGGKKWLWWAIGGGVAAAIIVAAVVTLMPRPEAAPPPVVEAPPPEPGGIELTVAEVGLEAADNASLLGRETAEVDRTAAEAAVEDSLAVLQEYLNAMFIEEDTRLSPAPLDDLLTKAAARAMVQADEQSLGAVALDVERSEGEPVDATATVVGDGDAIDLVLVDYDLVVNLELADGSSEQLTQHAEMGFVRDGGQWRVQAVDATLDVPDVVDDTKADESSQSEDVGATEDAEEDQ